MRPNPKSQSVPKRPITIAVDPKKTQDLRSRLVDRGISPVPLPSVKRPKMQNASFSIIKKNKDIYSLSEPKSPNISFIQAKPQAENSILRDLPNRSSASGYISAGKLRPSTASKKRYVIKNMDLDTTDLPKSRPVTTQNSRSYIRNPSSFKNFSVDESFRAMSLVQHMKGIKIPLRNPKQIFNPSFYVDEGKDENYPIDEEPISKFENNDVDDFIRMLQEEGREGSFLYCIQIEPHNPYHLKSIISPQGQDYYFTVSKSGVSVFVDGSPQEFTKLSDWLIEREGFNNLRSIPFFKKFRT